MRADSHPRLIEKFTIHNQLEKADRFEKLVRVFQKKTLSNTYQNVHHSILRLLISLSKDSLSTKSIILQDTVLNREKKREISTSEELAAFNKLLNEGLESSVKADTAEESSKEEADEVEDLKHRPDNSRLEKEQIVRFLSTNQSEPEKQPSPQKPFHSQSGFFGGYPFGLFSTCGLQATAIDRSMERQSAESLELGSQSIGKKRTIASKESEDRELE